MTRSVRAPVLRYALPVLIAGALALPALAVTQNPGPVPPRGPDPDRMFQALDANGDGVIDAPEMKAARLKRFDAMDVNKDGRLTKAEIEQAFARPGRPGDMDGIGGPPPAPPSGGPGAGAGRPDRRQMADRYAARIGADGPDGISREDFAAREAPMVARIDQNRDGKISRSEFDTFAERVKAHMMKPGRPGPGGGPAPGQTNP